MQFVHSRVKAHTLAFLLEILLIMDVGLSTFIFFLPISFGPWQAVVPLRGTLLTVVQGVHQGYLWGRHRVQLIVLLRRDGGYPGPSEVLESLLALDTFSSQVQRFSEFLGVML